MISAYFYRAIVAGTTDNVERHHRHSAGVGWRTNLYGWGLPVVIAVMPLIFHQ